MRRRRFLGASGAAAAGLVLGAGRARTALAETRLGPGPYGALLAPNADTIALPEGFTSRVVAVAGEVVPGSDVAWHPFCDGAAVIPADDGGWWYVSNSEAPFIPGIAGDGVAGQGGVSALRFASDGAVAGARTLIGESVPGGPATTMNCSGGRTPWGTWLSCEEWAGGLVFECDPATGEVGVATGLGTFSHEAAAVDPVRHRVYLTEDDLIDGEIQSALGPVLEPLLGAVPLPLGGTSAGGFYRYTPSAAPGPDGRLDLTDGTLECALLGEGPGGPVTWVEVDPSRAFSTTTLPQVVLERLLTLGSPRPLLVPVPQPRPTLGDGRTYEELAGASFGGAEGCWYSEGHVYFTAKVPDLVWDHDIEANTISLLYAASDFGGEAGAPLVGVDNLMVSQSGDIFVAEDGGNMELVLISAADAAGDREVAPFLRFDQPADQTEVSGIDFSPDGTRLYVASRTWGRSGPGDGVIYEVTGPFRGAQAPPPAPPPTTPAPPPPAPTTPSPAAPAAPAPVRGRELARTGGAEHLPRFAAGALLAAGAALHLRNRTAVDPDPEPDRP